jgi:hypothetical protein
LLPVLSVYAQPQSFYISPNQTISNGGYVRGYCLEYTKDVLSFDNFEELTRIIGNVTVVLNNKKEQTISLNELLNGKKKRIEIIPFDSYEHLQFVFLDKKIAQIKIGKEGLRLFREDYSITDEYVNSLTEQNIQKILELEAKGKSHTEIQHIIWRTRIIKEIERTNSRLTMDFQTTQKEAERVRSTFNKSSTVSYEQNGKTFMRIDGLLGSNDINEYIIELITHFHNDHISRSVVEQCIKEGSFNRIIAPYPMLDDSRNRIFSIIEENEGIKEYNFKQENRVLEITSGDRKLASYLTHEFGDFNYSSFQVNKDINVKMFKYQKPQNDNTDGLIYIITHKNVSYLIFGDFDDPAGIENLLDTSAANERRVFEIKEERSKLEVEEIKIIVELDKLFQKRSSIIHKPNSLYNLNKQIEEKEKIIDGLEEQIEQLNKELDNLIYIKADVIKHPHHAHIFGNNANTDSIIEKLNDVFEPHFFIWQRHQTQSSEQFKKYIERFKFFNKYLCSDELEINFFSLLEHFNTRRYS